MIAKKRSKKKPAGERRVPVLAAKLAWLRKCEADIEEAWYGRLAAETELESVLRLNEVIRRQRDDLAARLKVIEGAS